MNELLVWVIIMVVVGWFSWVLATKKMDKINKLVLKENKRRDKLKRSKL